MTIKEYEKYLKENPEVIKKITGNLTSDEKMILEKDKEIKINFIDIFKAKSTKLENLYFNYMNKQELKDKLKVFETPEISRYLGLEIVEEPKELEKYKEIYEKKLDLNEDQKIDFSELTILKIEEYRTKMNYRTGEKEKKLIRKQINFIPISSNFSFNKSYVNGFNKVYKIGKAIQNEGEEKKTYYNIANRLNEKSILSGYTLINKIKNLEIENNFKKEIDNKKNVNLTKIKEYLLNNLDNIYSNMSFLEEGSDNFKIYENKISNEKNKNFFKLSKGRKGLSEFFNSIETMEIEQINYGIKQIYSAMKEINEEFVDKLFKEKKLDPLKKEEILNEFIEEMNNVDLNTSPKFEEFRKVICKLFKISVEESKNYQIDFNDFKNFGMKYNYFSDKEIIKKYFNKIYFKVLESSVATCNLLILNPDKEKEIIRIMKDCIERKFSNCNPKSYFSQDGVFLDILLKKYENILKVRMDIEYTVDQEKEYKSLLENKKNIKKEILEHMVTTPFNKYFDKVEFDNSVIFSDLQNTKVEEATMDKFEKEFENLSPIFEKLNLKGGELKFRKLGRLNAKAAYIPSKNIMAIDINVLDGMRSFLHELGHKIDYTRETKLSLSKDFQNCVSAYSKAFFKAINEENLFGMFNERVINYYLNPSEIFARSFEFYLSEKKLISSFSQEKEQMKTNQGYIFDYMSDNEKSEIINFIEEKLDLSKEIEKCNEISIKKEIENQEINIDVSLFDIKKENKKEKKNNIISTEKVDENKNKEIKSAEEKYPSLFNNIQKTKVFEKANTEKPKEWKQLSFIKVENKRKKTIKQKNNEKKSNKTKKDDGGTLKLF